MIVEDFISRIFSIGKHPSPKEEFEALALEAFEFQREHCKVYREFLDLTEKGDFHPSSVVEIPFLPIRFFKSRDILSAPASGNSIVFTSSATTGMVPSHHIVHDISVYEKSFTEGFGLFYGESGTYNLLALLPSYLERKGSSLVYMAEKLIARAKANGAEGGFYLYNHDELLSELKRLQAESPKRKTILLGVSFALLDFASFVAEQIPDTQERRKIFSDVVIMETGGMKGRGEELSREELHRRLANGFAGGRIDSEYGMCELLSQAYSFPVEGFAQARNVDGVFFTPPWMRVMTRDFLDSLRITVREPYSTGGLDIIDLANIYSCCFIETEDQGRVFYACNAKKSVHPPFTVDGRIKNSERRGCNMLIE